MAKFNTRIKKPKNKKHVSKPIKKPELQTTETVTHQLERDHVVFRKSKYHKKIQSKIHKIIDEA